MSFFKTNAHHTHHPNLFDEWAAVLVTMCRDLEQAALPAKYTRPIRAPQRRLRDIAHGIDRIKDYTRSAEILNFITVEERDGIIRVLEMIRYQAAEADYLPEIGKVFGKDQTTMNRIARKST